jgi:hypothetical protein
MLAVPGATVIFDSVVWVPELESLHPVSRPNARNTKHTDTIFTKGLDSKPILSASFGGKSIRED